MRRLLLGVGLLLVGAGPANAATPEQHLASASDNEATRDAPTQAGTLRRPPLARSRDVLGVKRAGRGAVAVSLSYRQSAAGYRDFRLKIVRAGKTRFDRPMPRFQALEPRQFGLIVRNLDVGEPEVIVDANTGGAHCCVVTLIYDYDAAKRA